MIQEYEYDPRDITKYGKVKKVVVWSPNFGPKNNAFFGGGGFFRVNI